MLTGLFLAFISVAAKSPGPALAIDVTSGRHTISPYIYGMNDNTGSVDPGLAKSIKLPTRLPDITG